MLILTKDKEQKEQAKKIQGQYEDYQKSLADQEECCDDSEETECCGRCVAKDGLSDEELELETLEGENDYVQRNL
jgi:hypothetical protein